MDYRILAITAEKTMCSECADLRAEGSRWTSPEKLDLDKKNAKLTFDNSQVKRRRLLEPYSHLLSKKIRVCAGVVRCQRKGRKEPSTSHSLPIPKDINLSKYQPQFRGDFFYALYKHSSHIKYILSTSGT